MGDGLEISYESANLNATNFFLAFFVCLFVFVVGPCFCFICCNFKEEKVETENL